MALLSLGLLSLFTLTSYVPHGATVPGSTVPGPTVPIHPKLVMSLLMALLSSWPYSPCTVPIHPN